MCFRVCCGCFFVCRRCWLFRRVSCLVGFQALGESPVSYASGNLRFVDIEGCKIYSYDIVANRLVREVGTGGRLVGHIVPCGSDALSGYDLLASLEVGGRSVCCRWLFTRGFEGNYSYASRLCSRLHCGSQRDVNCM